ncbi:hypothetical protein Pcinc_042778 [Petrolisthes cinctipes]|uniref:Uncharacterized protein n=1 Tax=Petrolisthes cinctipes TaxID=88211 RepID=A0AAE1BKH2_PETCI|nr:hypothetical protein Pcinc_042778 [Petrolisthes cinctipes]
MRGSEGTRGEVRRGAGEISSRQWVTLFKPARGSLECFPPVLSSPSLSCIFTSSSLLSSSPAPSQYYLSSSPFISPCIPASTPPPLTTHAHSFHHPRPRLSPPTPLSPPLSPPTLQPPPQVAS